MKHLFRVWLGSVAILLMCGGAEAQTVSTAQVVGTCGAVTYIAGRAYPVTQDTTGTLCTVSGGGGGTTNATIVSPLGSQTSPNGVSVTIASDQAAVAVKQATAANLNATVVGTGTFAVQSTTSPGSRTFVTLDVKTVTTGGTAVTALTAGHRTAGGFIQNPPSATVNLCINEIGAATGTTSSGDTTCIVPGQSYGVSPAAGAVSVISSDSAHPFSGYGLN